VLAFRDAIAKEEEAEWQRVTASESRREPEKNGGSIQSRRLFMLPGV